MDSGIKAVIGLGNPGRRYPRTRHNAGFRVLDMVADALEVKSWTFDCNAAIGIDGLKDLVLAKPMTYMNNSGIAVKAILEKFGLDPFRILVVYDDMYLPPGTIRIRKGGGHGGHKGMGSIIGLLGTEDIPRVRVGIGRPRPGTDPVEYVLEELRDEEFEVLRKGEAMAVEAILFLLEEGMEKAMNKYNKKGCGMGDGL
jgi:PTH1 family peptidyl-tRNA hydrolase